MAKPLSEDLRSRVVAAVDGGMSRRAAAERFGVAASTAIRWASRRPAPACGCCRPTRPTSTRFGALPRTDAFAKLKALLRKAAARTIPDLWGAIRDALPRFTAGECANYFAVAGYEPT